MSTKAWREQAPSTPGVYLWRRTPQWEPILREVTPERLIYSQRYCQLVPVEKLGGQWHY